MGHLNRGLLSEERGLTSGDGQVGSTRGSIPRRGGPGQTSRDVGLPTQTAASSNGRSTVDPSLAPFSVEASAAAGPGNGRAGAVNRSTAKETDDACVKAELTVSCEADPKGEGAPRVLMMFESVRVG